jgi:hypothetical protein
LFETNSDSHDEERVIIALGILAGILAFFQLKASDAKYLPFTLYAPATAYLSQIQYELVGILLAFSIYLFLFTLALGWDALGAGNWVYQLLKDWADVCFWLGSFILIPFVVDTFLFLESEVGPTGANPNTNSAAYAGFIILFIVLTLIVAVIFKTGRRN